MHYFHKYRTEGVIFSSMPLHLLLIFLSAGLSQGTLSVETSIPNDVGRGEQAILNCTFAPDQVASIAWIKYRDPVIRHNAGHANGIYDDYVGRVDLVGQASLRINDTKCEDTGKYTCQITIGHGNVKSSSGNLTIQRIPNVPINMTITQKELSSVTIQWKENSTDQCLQRLTYKIQYNKLDSGSWISTEAQGSQYGNATLTHVITGLENGTYNFRLQTVNPYTNDSSAYTDIMSVRILGPHLADNITSTIVNVVTNFTSAVTDLVTNTTSNINATEITTPTVLPNTSVPGQPTLTASMIAPTVSNGTTASFNASTVSSSLTTITRELSTLSADLSTAVSTASSTICDNLCQSIGSCQYNETSTRCDCPLDGAPDQCDSFAESCSNTTALTCTSNCTRMLYGLQEYVSCECIQEEICGPVPVPAKQDNLALILGLTLGLLFALIFLIALLYCFITWLI